MPNPLPSPRSPMVLVVDDDPGLLRLMEKALRREGLTPVTAGTGRAALAWLVEHSADLLLLDLKLPDLEAIDMIQQLDQQKRTLPFVIITGQGDERVAVDMMKRGAIDYLVKDARFLEFLPGVVQRALHQLERDQKLAAAEEALHRSEANLARAQQIAHLGSYELRVPFDHADYRSQEIFRILGLDPAHGELSAQQYLQRVVHPEDRSRYQQVIDKTVREAVPFDFEYRIVRPDGAVRHVHSVGEPVLDAQQNVIRVVGTLLDITERRRLEQEILEISDLEQRRIGQDLHDGLCQHLAAVELMSQVLEQKLEKRSRADAARAAEIARQVREAISQTRLLARGLSPVVLESEGLMSALEELAANTGKLFHVACRFSCDSPVLIHNHTVATHLYRIAQQAVSNAIKHGKAKQIHIELSTVGEHFHLSIQDDGAGFPKTSPRTRGMGLRIMQYRAGLIGGSLLIQPGPHGGTRVACALPRQPVPPKAP